MSAAMIDDLPKLKAQLRRAERLKKLKALALIAPLVIFLLLAFVFPIGTMLWRGIDNSEMQLALPQTAQLLQQWDGQNLPSAEVFKSLASELPSAQKSGALGKYGRRLNYEDPTLKTLMTQTLRKMPIEPPSDWSQTLPQINPRWSDPKVWQALKNTAPRLTDRYLLASVDVERNAQGDLQFVAPDKKVYLDIFQRTLIISGTVTLVCLLLGFPLAYLLATLPTGTSNLLMIFVLLPFWTSLLVRTAAWIVLLQSGGLVNNALIGLGIIQEPLQLVFNRFGVIVAMTHILLPFMILPLYSVMKGISPSYQRAAISLGAHPFKAFWQVYVPQTLAGVAAGTILVFIMALGYYITPALLGGPSDQMVSYYVAYYTNTTNNWSMAAALGSLLLIATLVLYAVYNHLVNKNPVRR
ncbi:ABC transporter permease [Thiolinea disciformis]|uniref:ABC transporter permease n=1 Tax=Thiolinea disciformis TaxID=125614 RepID=UPI00036297D2|nr:ABC transporter permease [Thiolinea disciformis]